MSYIFPTIAFKVVYEKNKTIIISEKTPVLNG
jgi:hypothetical protein